MKIEDPILSLKGIGGKTQQLFEKLEIITIEDLLYHFPSRYEYYDNPMSIQKAALEDVGIVEVTVAKQLESKKVKHLYISKYLVTDGTSELVLTFYNMPYLQKVLYRGASTFLRGSIQVRNNQYRMEQPTLYTRKQYELLQGKYQPIYSLTKGISNQMIRKSVQQALEMVEELRDPLPQYVLEKGNVIAFQKAIWQIHSSEEREELEQARRRLVFQEFYEYFYRLLTMREERISCKNQHIMEPVEETNVILKKLPYELTKAQKRVWEEVQVDLASTYVMNRLVQGDVGSGKTIIAYLALIMCVGNGGQGALMVPTEVLAKQHYDGLLALLEENQLSMVPILVTGSLTAKEKRLAREQIVEGTAHIIIGTHALIQESVDYHNLTLVITDEQHRFGVRQREGLTEKGNQPHVLVMSATPIPRTLALVLYADIELSIIDELPKNRLRIQNCVIDPMVRRKSYDFIKEQVEQGHQTYIICSMVEETEVDRGLENVVDYTKKLREYFPKNMVIEYLHGKMKPALKDEIMMRFGRGEIQILVSTTVIEVGINVPNATVMMIEDAQQFGLAQLHQLRGRVGRGMSQSYCILVNTTKSKSAKERLEILNQSNDGFYIAKKDMELRGSGDLGGIRQSGEMMFRLGDIMEDAQLLREAHQCAVECYRG
ncbi:MAG: ATP-dependent DNA helicase RecG [Eubacteriales bacterium]